MVSADQITNPLGAVPVFDGGNPRIFTAKALSETLSGGTLCHISGTTNDVGSDVASYVAGDLTVVGAQDVQLFNGIVLQNVVSGGTTSVATRGAFLMRAGEIVSGGAWVGHNASGNVVNYKGHKSGTALIFDAVVGRAMTTSASGTNAYCLVSLLG